MQIFICWSKQISHGLALVLHEWLPAVIHQLDPWMSSEDISKGQRWRTEVGERLDHTSQGIICVTRENMKEPWLNFEAGALAKSLQNSAVRPILLDVKQSEIVGPLDQFQATIATDAQDMLKLVKSLNVHCDAPLEDNRLERVFNWAWDEYWDKVQNVVDRNATQEAKPQREMSDMLGEVLERIRDMQRSFAQEVASGSSHDSIRPRRRTSLSDMAVADLCKIAKELGIEDTEGMRKRQLIDAIKMYSARRQ